VTTEGKESKWRRGCRWCKRNPKNFDLSKIREKSLKIWAKSLRVWAKSLTIWAKWCPTFAEKSHTPEDHPKKRSSRSLLENICRQKSHKTFRASLGKFGENPSLTEKNAYSYTYAQEWNEYVKILFV